MIQYILHSTLHNNALMYLVYIICCYVVKCTLYAAVKKRKEKLDGDVIKQAPIPILRITVLPSSRSWKFLLPRTTCKSDFQGLKCELIKFRESRKGLGLRSDCTLSPLLPTSLYGDPDVVDYIVRTHLQIRTLFPLYGFKVQGSRFQMQWTFISEQMSDTTHYVEIHSLIIRCVAYVLITIH